VSLDPGGTGSYCPFLMIEDTDGIDAVSIIHHGGMWGAPTYGFMDVYSDVVGAGPACLMGDANGDGKVGIADLSALADNYGRTNATWRMGDFSEDGKVGIADLSALADNYGKTGAPCDPEATIVPEPVTLAMLAIGGLLLRKKR
ncbi:MAG: PEP-CTERM sorting domain-containing protein, partial [Planctomycetota bacterium]